MGGRNEGRTGKKLPQNSLPCLLVLLFKAVGILSWYEFGVIGEKQDINRPRAESPAS